MLTLVSTSLSKPYATYVNRKKKIEIATGINIKATYLDQINAQLTQDK